MVLELHIWGPAFGLASIDSECLAATAYFRSVLPDDEWILVAAHDPSWSPTGDFPALKNNSVSIGGFNAIVNYLEAQGWSLNTSPRTREQSADFTALSSHLAANSLPLLDCLLYTTPDSYIHTTRPAWAHILPRAATLVIPSHRQSAAEIRSAAAGITFPSEAISDLDGHGDINDPQQQQQRAAALQSNSPSLLFARRRTVQAALRKEAASTRFRLENLVANLLEPLQAGLKISKKQKSEEDEEDSATKLSSLHCLAFGYLAIMLYAPVPHPWFAETAGARYPGVVEFITQTRQSVFGSAELHAQTIMAQVPQLHSSLGSTTLSLPWRVSAPPPITFAFTSVVHQLFNFMISPAQRWMVFSQSRKQSGSSIPSLPILGLAAAPPLLTGFAYFVYTTFFSPSASQYSYWGGNEVDKHFGRPLYANKLEELGEAGAMLSMIQGF